MRQMHLISFVFQTIDSFLTVFSLYSLGFYASAAHTAPEALCFVLSVPASSPSSVRWNISPFAWRGFQWNLREVVDHYQEQIKRLHSGRNWNKAAGYKRKFETTSIGLPRCQTNANEFKNFTAKTTADAIEDTVWR